MKDRPRRWWTQPELAQRRDVRCAGRGSSRAPDCNTVPGGCYVESSEGSVRVIVDAHTRLLFCLLKERGVGAGQAFFEFHIDVGCCPCSPGFCFVHGYSDGREVVVDVKACFIAKLCRVVNLFVTWGGDGDADLGGHPLVLLWHAEECGRVAEENIPKGAADGAALMAGKEPKQSSSAFDVQHLVSLAHAGDTKELEITLRLRVFPHIT